MNNITELKRTETASAYLRAMIFLLKELSIILNLNNPSAYEIIEEVRKLKESQKK